MEWIQYLDIHADTAGDRQAPTIYEGIVTLEGPFSFGVSFEKINQTKQEWLIFHFSMFDSQRVPSKSFLQEMRRQPHIEVQQAACDAARPTVQGSFKVA